MNTKRETIKNRHGLKLVIQVDEPEKPTKLVFIAHGQGGFIEQVHIQAFAEAFLENNFRVVRFDATHSIGESGGELFDVTFTSYIEDLEDVINWARKQTWFQQPYALCGQSMGAQSTAWYAENHRGEVSLLAPLAPLVNYKLHIRNLDPEYLKSWQAKGYTEMASRSKPGIVKKIGWGVNEDLKKYDLLPKAEQLTMPVLLMVGEFDKVCGYDNQKIFLDAIPGQNKKLVVIKGAEHSFRNHRTGEYDEKINQAKQALSDWLKLVR